MQANYEAIFSSFVDAALGIPGPVFAALDGAPLLIMTDENGEVFRACSMDGAPATVRGPLRLTIDQIDALAERRKLHSRKKIITFLRETAPEETRARSDAEMMRLAGDSEKSAREMGLTTERSIGLWSHLMIATDGKVATQPKVRAGVTYGPGTPDENFRDIFGVMTLLARSDR